MLMMLILFSLSLSQDLLAEENWLLTHIYNAHIPFTDAEEES